jgi:hypothetical protein
LYQNFDRLRGAADLADEARAFQRAGYDVQAFANASRDDIAGGLAVLDAASGAADRLVVYLAGRFVTDGDRTWPMMPDAKFQSIFDLHDNMLSVETVMTLLSRAPGQAVLVLGFDGDQRDRVVCNLRQGIGRLDVPQGVTVLRGAPRAVKTEINDAILAPGANVVGSGVANRGVTVLGYHPRDLMMQPDTANAQPAPVAPRASLVDRVRENAVWTDAQSRGTVAAYQSYLQTYPRGAYVQAAQDAIEAI